MVKIRKERGRPHQVMMPVMENLARWYRSG